MTRDPTGFSGAAKKVSEKVLQTHAVAALMRLVAAGEPILFAGDMAGSRRTPAEALWAKATGLVAGEPDLRVYGPAGSLLSVEMKTRKGILSPAQLARHARLRELGHTVRVIYAATGEEAAAQITEAVRGWLTDYRLSPSKTEGA